MEAAQGDQWRNAPDSGFAMVGASAEAPADKLRGPGMRLLGNLLIVLLSVLFTIAALEGIMRLFPSMQVQTGDGEFIYCTPVHSRHLPDDRYGHIEIPGNSYFERYSSLDPWAYVHINGEGFRDNFRPSGAAPVFVLGDSMTRGSIVNENETYTNLLDRWVPTMSFRNYGMGGYGQANAVNIYEDKAPTLPHRLAIGQFSLSTDIDDNVETAKLEGNGVKIAIKPTKSSESKAVKWYIKPHLFLWAHSKLYPWVYNVAVRPFFNNWDARKNIDGAIELTRRLLVRLAADTKANGADLLVLVLPSWAEMADKNDGMEPEKQRRMLRKFAADTPGVYLLDMTPVLRLEDPNRTYGVIDKHLTPYGHFLIARELDDWLARQWPNGSGARPVQRTMIPPRPVIPDCSRAGAYLQKTR